MAALHAFLKAHSREEAAHCRERDVRVRCSPQDLFKNLVNSTYGAAADRIAEPKKQRKNKKARDRKSRRGPLIFNPGGDLRSRAVTRAVSSALQGLTSVFGMGTGVTLAVRPPGNLKFETLKPKLEARISFTRASNFEYRVSMINRRKQADHKFHLKVMQCGKDCLTFHASAHPCG